MAHHLCHTIFAAVLALVVLLFTATAASVLAALTPAQNSNTLAFLQLFSSSIPDLSSVWTGSNWCSWTYLDCTNTSNVTLIIDGAALTGSLPALTSEVTGSSVALHTIALMNMNITGSFPESWGSLTALRVVNLGNTNLFGTLPRSWNAITGLTSVYAARSGVCGNLPNWTHSSMLNLDLSDNYLRGTLPSSWATMAKLENVNINGNHLCGCVPKSWMARVLEYAAVRSLGLRSHAPNCRSTAKCNAAQECSRAAPDYGDAVAAPVYSVVAALTLAVVVATAVFAL